ncbi:hypothetical protein QJQ45_019375 [Haematococcus lacustris]|nr:hypothetical protein QJQ45_019375 [Haematococcus lacustris]
MADYGQGASHYSVPPAMPMPLAQPAAPQVPTITSFQVVQADDPSSLSSLSDVKSLPLIVTGMLLSPYQAPSAFQTPVLSDWMIQYGQLPGIWVCSGSQWWKLAEPAPQYAKLFLEAQRKLDLSVRCATQLQANPASTLQMALPSILHPGMSGSGSMATYTIPDLQVEAGFIGAQLVALVPSLGLVAGQMYPLMADLARLGTPLVFVNDEADASEVDTTELQELQAAGLLAAPPSGHLPSRTALSRARLLAAQVTADLDRGPPPQPTTSFRLEPSMVPDMLLVWDLCMTFSNLLQLPPISMEAFEAAIMPGPLPALQPQPAPVAGPPGGVTSVDSEGGRSTNDRMDAGMAGLPHHDTASGGAAFNMHSLLDLDAAASAAVLRDVHAALLKCVDGFSIKKVQEAPTTGRLAADDAKAEQWQARTCAAILESRSATPISHVAKEAAELIKNREYYLLTPRQRLAILRALADMALASDVLREYTQKVDMPGNAQLSERGEAQDPESWMRWVEAYKTGVRKPLGRDTRQRSYWALGGRAACWRLYVCGGEGGGWGWYEGPGLQALRDWMRSGGGNNTEAPLLKALHTVPLPHKHTQDALPPYPLVLPEAPLGAGPASIPWSAADLKARRPDAYKTLAAPLLKGECHQPLLVGLHAWTVEERLLNCIESLITEFEFWTKPRPWLARVAMLLSVLKGKNSGQQAAVVKEVEQLLHDSARLQPAWAQHLRACWLRSLSRPELNTKDVAMHVLAVQKFIRDEPYALTRLAFIRQAQVARCPLQFHAGGDVVVFLRTGCVLHLDKYAKMGSCYSVDELGPVMQQLHHLRPVERMRVVAAGYRSYPVTNAEAALRALADSKDLDPAAPTAARPVFNNPNRPPCQWLLMQPLTADGADVDTTRGEVVLPMHVDASLPEYLVRVETYERGMAKRWQAGDRFRMNFGAKSNSKGTAGVWYKGTIKRFVQTQTHTRDSNYDPWNSLLVVWDSDGGVAEHKVNPWEIEVDPEEAKRREEERRKQAEAQARARRAAAKSQRSTHVHLDDLVDEDISEEESEELSDSDDSYEGRRAPAKKKAKMQNDGRGGRGGGGNNMAAQRQAQPQQSKQAMEGPEVQQWRQQLQVLSHNLQLLQRQGQGNSTQAQQYAAAIQQLHRYLQNPQAARQQVLQQQAYMAQQQQRAGQGTTQLTQQQQMQLAQQQMQLAQQQRQGGLPAGISQAQLQQMQMQQQQLRQQQMQQMQMQQQQQAQQQQAGWRQQ